MLDGREYEGKRRRCAGMEMDAEMPPVAPGAGGGRASGGRKGRGRDRGGDRRARGRADPPDPPDPALAPFGMPNDRVAAEGDEELEHLQDLVDAVHVPAGAAVVPPADPDSELDSYDLHVLYGRVSHGSSQEKGLTII